MSRFSIALLTLACSFVVLSCSNVLAPIANKTTDEANYENAMKALDAGSFGSSISYFQSLSPTYLSRADVMQNYAGAYAGQCGLVFIPYFLGLASTSISGSSLLKVIMNQWTGEPLNPAACVQAEALIEQIWTSSPPTSSQQLFISLNSMVKIGQYLRSKADNAENSGGGDGNTDAAFDACANTNDSHHLTDAEVSQIVTGFSLLLQNVVGFVASLSSDLSEQLSDVETACSLLNPNPCATTNVANVTAGMITSFRNLIATSPTNPTAPFGIGSCTNVDPTTCCP